jgi:two-component system response regulator YesN
VIKVLIVDDEMLIRVGIKSCINREPNDYEVIGLAEDGLQALEIIEKMRPEIVLTDIKMPNMDGLELIERVKKQYPSTRIIVLSCYNEIDFIKKAMKLGADDYILKLSMQPEDLLNILNSVKDALVSEEEEKLQSSNNKLEMKINKEFIKEDLYKKALDNSISAARLVEELKNMGSSMSFKRTCVVCVSIDDYLNASMKSRLNDKHLLKFSVTNILQEILAAYYTGDIIEIEKGEFLIIIDLGEETNYKDTLKELCIKVNSALDSYFNISVTFGISKISEDFKDLKSMYSEAEKALEQAFYYGRGSILFYEKGREFTDKIILLNLQDEKLLISCLDNLDEEGAKNIVHEFFNNISTSREYQPSKVRMAAIEIFNSFIRVAKKYEVESEFTNSISDLGSNPVDMCNKVETITDIQKCLGDIIGRLTECLLSKRLGAERPEILKLKQVISERIYEEITLDKAAKMTNMSKSYLSSVFKKETGESFTDYVNRLKMEEAKVLIQKHNLKNYEAAEKLGFVDESYFSKLFKKYNGISPSKVNSK